VAVDPIKMGGIEGKFSVDVTRNFNLYEEYWVMERFNVWMELEHSR
jgi:hypothetical protein